MKRILLLIILTYTCISISGQNIFKYEIQAKGGLKIGSSLEGVWADTVLTSADQTLMRSSLNWRANTSYEIRDSINLGGNTITLPLGVVLKFNGGKLSNGTLNGNHAAFISNGSQIFDTTLTLTGTWQTGEITPQDYGAITVASNTVYTYDCSPAFRKCLSSIFSIKVPPGYYYIKNTLYANIPKVVYAGEGLLENIDYYSGFTMQVDHARLFSDKNIDFVRINTGMFFWLGGTFDARTIPHHTNCFFRYDYNNHVYGWGGKLKFNGIGNKDALRVDQTGTTAVWFNGEAATETWGYYCDIDIEGSWQWLAYGLRIDADDFVTHNSWSNSIRSNITMDGVRNGWYIEGANSSVHKGLIQARNIFNPRSYTPAVYLGPKVGNIFIDIAFWDFGGNAFYDGYYFNYNTIQDNGYKNTYGELVKYAMLNGSVGRTARFADKERYNYGSSRITQTSAHGASRPLYPNLGELYFDSYLGIPIWYNGNYWVRADGSEAISYNGWGIGLNDGLSAYYSMDETTGSTINDESTNANHATVNGATINQTGKIGRAVLFDGLNDYLSLPVHSSLNVNASDFSISAWVNFTGTTDGVIVGGDASGDPYFSISSADSLLGWGVQGYVGPYKCDTALTRNSWHHVVLVHDSIGTNSSRNYIYIDGRWAASYRAVGEDYINSLSNFSRIGMGNVDKYFKGLIDEVAIYKRTLSIDEVLRLYDHGNGRAYSRMIGFY